VAVSDKLLNNIRYNGNGYGIGKSTKSFAENEGDYYWVDPNKSEPIKADQGAIRSIAGKMSKFFRDTLQAVTISKRSIIGFYNAFYDEYTLSIESESGVVTQIPFDAGNWVGDTYAIPNMSDISIVQPTNGNVVQSSGYLHNYTGNVAGYYPFQIIFGAVTRNICVTVTAAQLTPNQFTFIDSTGRPLSTVVVSNGILVTGIVGLSPISIVGGAYEINNSGVWLTTAGTVSEFDSIKVRGTSSASFTTGVDVTLTIGGVSDTFTITTIAEPVAGTNTYIYNNLFGATLSSVLIELDEYLSTPISFGENTSAIHDVVTQSISFNGSTSTSGIITLTVNSVLIETLPITENPFSGNFTTLSISATDIIEITLFEQ
jgi:hypothetical protein